MVEALSDYVCIDNETGVATTYFSAVAGDPDGDLVSLAIYFTDPRRDPEGLAVAVLCGMSSNCEIEPTQMQFSDPGKTTVTCICTDDEGLQDRDSVRIYIVPHIYCGAISDWEELPDLIDDIDELQLQIPLEKQYDHAFDALFENENEKAASNILQGMVNLLDAQLNKKISQTEYDELIEYINRINPEPVP